MVQLPRHRRASFLLLLLGMAGACCAAENPSGPNPAGMARMKKYVGACHVLYTDLPEKDAKKALVRLTVMAEMYRQFAPGPPVREQGGKWPVYLYRRFEDYRRSRGSSERLNAGRYDGLVLRAVLDPETFCLADVWRMIQHEGWHQYSHRVLQQSSPPPLWLEEGLAEYFGAAVWKDGKFHPGYVDAGAYVQRGDTFALQPGRLQRVQTRIRTGQFRPLEKLVTMRLDDWRKQTNALNHDQVWSFVHFLLHADGGKRREALRAYLAEVLRNPPKKSKRLEVFQTHFGGDIHKLQKEYETWWLSQPTPAAVEAFPQPNRFITWLGRLAQASQGHLAPVFLQIFTGETPVTRLDRMSKPHVHPRIARTPPNSATTAVSMRSVVAPRRTG